MLRSLPNEIRPLGSDAPTPEDELRSLLSGFLTIYGEVADETLTLWVKTLLPVRAGVAGACIAWMRSFEGQPNPATIFKIASGTVGGDAVEIATAKAGEYGFTFDEVCSPNRSIPLTRGRHAVMAALSDAGHSYSQIGALLNKDPSTVMHGVRAHRQRVEDGEDG